MSFRQTRPCRFRWCFSLSLSLLILLSIFSPLPQSAQTAQVTLAWDPNSEPNLLGYIVHYGTVSRNYQVHMEVGNNTQATISNLQDGGTYYIAVTALDSSANESGYSNEVVYSAPLACSFSISPASQPFTSSGGSGTIGVTGSSGCPWTSVSNNSWIVITSNATATGSGTTYYSVSPNTNASARTGTLTIAGRVFTVSQSGASSQYSLNITKAGTGSGTVTNSPTGSTFNAGTTVTLTAAPNASSTFAGWSGACSGASPTCTVAMNANASVTAAFNLRSLNITATAGANGAISPPGTVPVNYGANQSFAITPNSGYQIADVKVDGVSLGAVASFLFGAVMSNHAIEATFSSLNSQPGETVSALNAGGKVYTDKAGVSYSADRYYQGGKTWKTSSSIAGTEDDALYKSERYGNFSYAVPVPKGNYVVTLKFAEIHWSSANCRIFNVKVGGQEVIRNLDLFAKVGKNRAYDVAIPVSVNDGILRIEFVSIKDNAKISAILVRKAQ